MPGDLAECPREAAAVLALARDTFGTALVAVYLHGSAVDGGLRHHSDVDVLVVVERSMTNDQREQLVAALLRLSGRYPPAATGPRCLELMVCQRPQLAVPQFPATREFLYGEWLRHDFEAGQRTGPESDPDMTLVLAQARQRARALFGPPLAELMPEVPVDEIRRAMRDALPALLESLPGDERNVLLTLARMWKTAATGTFCAKDVAATWAMAQLPDGIATVLADARAGYLGTATDDWQDRHEDALRAADHLHARVAALV